VTAAVGSSRPWAAAAVLGGNLGGSTSALLAADGGGAARRLRLDVLFPVAGYRRCLDLQAGFGAAPRRLGTCALRLGMGVWLPPACCPELLSMRPVVQAHGPHLHLGSTHIKVSLSAGRAGRGAACEDPACARRAEFVYPAAWLADQTLYFRAAQRQEQRRGLDPPALPRRAPQAGPRPPPDRPLPPAARLHGAQPGACAARPPAPAPAPPLARLPSRDARRLRLPAEASLPHMGSNAAAADIPCLPQRLPRPVEPPEPQSGCAPEIVCHYSRLCGGERRGRRRMRAKRLTARGAPTQRACAITAASAAAGGAAGPHAAPGGRSAGSGPGAPPGSRPCSGVLRRAGAAQGAAARGGGAARGVRPAGRQRRGERQRGGRAAGGRGVPPKRPGRAARGGRALPGDRGCAAGLGTHHRAAERDGAVRSRCQGCILHRLACSRVCCDGGALRSVPV
jgi:hypothetical protein